MKNVKLFLMMVVISALFVSCSESVQELTEEYKDLAVELTKAKLAGEDEKTADIQKKMDKVGAKLKKKTEKELKKAKKNFKKEVDDLIN